MASQSSIVADARLVTPATVLGHPKGLSVLFATEMCERCSYYALGALLALYVGIDLGAFLSPVICGTLGEGLGWHYGFTAAGFGMTLGLIIYLSGYSTLPPDELHKTTVARAPLTRDEKRAVYALLALFIPV